MPGSSGLLWTTVLYQTPARPQPTMIHLGHILFLLLLPVAAAQTTPGSCSGCGSLSLPLLAGLVAADAVASLLIVGAVFLCARPRRSPAQDGKVYINMPGRG
ncbi:hematopoietic cell signal transducer isoform X2 [Macaca thibetana thibetana]|uniref:hematopoietic cell signal transducer isoform X2 n=1 Tax=Macaca thibetana thibetana TaxID=257877 RepID=UPI001E25765A|nr:hematopoietic cell signal transducer isoform X2 [Macaca fascicularis]XP_050625328.1 hematopoietic cell signal transducer isoform X2 [Macaca thibetana thibetana]